MNGPGRQLTRLCLAVLLATSTGARLALANALVPAELAPGVTRFALDTGNLPPVIELLPQLNAESADYLSARALLSTGQSHKARALFEKVFASDVHRAEAALELARMAEAADDRPSAVRWYQEASGVGFGEVRQQAILGLADAERQRGKIDHAGQYLASMDDGYWAAVGYMNLAADFARDDLSPSRALVALRVAMAMAAKDQNRARSRDLLDRLYLRAGYLSLRTDEYDKATDFLEKVSLESYYTPQALYLHGLALSEKGHQRAAMQSWHRAKKFPLAFPGVSDAWLGMGRGYDLAGYPGQAGESWLAANAAYEGERVTLGKLAERVRQEGAYKTLVDDARGADAAWFLADNRTLTQPRLAYLLRFLEDSGAQTSVHRVARLDELSRAVDASRHNLDVFIQALEAHLASVTARSVRASLARLDDQQAQLTKALAQRMRQASRPEQTNTFDHLERRLQSSQQRLASLSQRVAGQPEQMHARLTHARELRAAVDRLQEQVSDARVRASAILDEQVLAFVSSEQQRMVHALNRTEQQIAHLYEYLALENLGEGAR